MTPLEDFIGQERAIRAIEFGLGVNKPGFNIFVTGLTGTGKTSIIKAFLKKTTSQYPGPTADAPVPEDWCYVYNFSDADRPQALKIRRGWGKLLKMDMADKTGKPLGEIIDLFAASAPQHRLIQPAEVAALAVLIASEQLGGMTGQAINVDGGAVMV